MCCNVRQRWQAEEPRRYRARESCAVKRDDPAPTARSYTRNSQRVKPAQTHCSDVMDVRYAGNGIDSGLLDTSKILQAARSRKAETSALPKGHQHSDLAHLSGRRDIVVGKGPSRAFDERLRLLHATKLSWVPPQVQQLRDISTHVREPGEVADGAQQRSRERLPTQIKTTATSTEAATA